MKIFNKITTRFKYSYKRFYCVNSFEKYDLIPPWNVLFFGTDEHSRATLKALFNSCKNNHLIGNLEVVTSVKEKASKKNAIERFAASEQLMIHDWPINPSICNKFHFGVIVGFGHLIADEIIKQFPLGILNIHPSLLPRWRGASPVTYAIANGDTTTGVSIMRIKPFKFDVGDIILQERVDIPPDARLPDVKHMLGDYEALTLMKTLDGDLLQKLSNAKPQSEVGVTYAPKVTSKMAQIDWNNMSAKQVYDLDRALTGMFNLATRFNEIPIKLVNINRSNGTQEENDSTSKIIPGQIVYRRSMKMLQIQCADGNWINVETLIVPGKKISAIDFRNGFINKCSDPLKLFK